MNEATKAEVLKNRLSRIEERIASEYEANNDRMNWLLVFQAILFGILSAVLEKTFDPGIRGAIVQVVFFLGISTAALALVGIEAGRIAIGKFKDIRDTIEVSAHRELGYDILGFSRRALIHKMGLTFGLWLPRLMLVAWGWLFIAKL